MTARTIERVSNVKFRDEFLRNEDITIRMVAEAAGWMRKGKARNGDVIRIADTSRVKRCLGIIPNTDDKMQTTIRDFEAMRLIDIFGFDPVDVDV